MAQNRFILLLNAAIIFSNIKYGYGAIISAGQVEPYVVENSSMTLYCEVSTSDDVTWKNPLNETVAVGGLFGCRDGPVNRPFTTPNCSDFFSSPNYFVNLTFNETHTDTDKGTWTCIQLTESKPVNVFFCDPVMPLGFSADLSKEIFLMPDESITISCTSSNCVNEDCGTDLSWPYYQNVTVTQIYETSNSTNCFNGNKRRTIHGTLAWNSMGSTGAAQCCIDSIPFNSRTCALFTITRLAASILSSQNYPSSFTAIQSTATSQSSLLNTSSVTPVQITDYTRTAITHNFTKSALSSTVTQETNTVTQNNSNDYKILIIAVTLGVLGAVGLIVIIVACVWYHNRSRNLPVENADQVEHAGTIKDNEEQHCNINNSTKKSDVNIKDSSRLDNFNGSGGARKPEV